MTCIDAYGLIALAAEEPAASEVEELVRGGDCRVVAVNLAETVDICVRNHGMAITRVREVLEPLTLSGILSVAVSDEAEAWLAADLRSRHYHKRQSPLSMADCLLLAHALSSGHELATSDPDLADAARSEGVTVIALPDSQGRRPE